MARWYRANHRLGEKTHVARAYGDLDINCFADADEPIQGDILQVPERLAARSQAAIAVGITEAVYLPLLTADVLAGLEQTSATAPGIGGPIPIAPGTLTTPGARFIPSLTVKWLLLDFGRRDAGREAATQLAFAANVTFNGTHQKLIFDVSNAYFVLTAARVQLKIARQTVQNAELVQAAAKARMGRGIATSIEVAQANQQVAQARFNLPQSQGHERNAYMTLLEAVWVSPTLEIRIADGSNRALPKAVPEDLNRLIATSLQRRPDVKAAFARLQTDKNGIAAARAEFMPKVALVGNVNRNIGSLSVASTSARRSASTSRTPTGDGAVAKHCRAGSRRRL